MNVAGDAAAFLFKCLFGRDGLKLVLMFAPKAQEDDSAGDESGEGGDSEFKPPRFPEKGLHLDGDGGALLVPVSGAVAGDHLEAIVSGGKAGEGDPALFVDDLPFFIDRMEAITGEGVFGGGKVEGGKGDDQVVVVRRKGDCGVRITQIGGPGIDIRRKDRALFEESDGLVVQ